MTEDLIPYDSPLSQPQAGGGLNGPTCPVYADDLREAQRLAKGVELAIVAGQTDRALELAGQLASLVEGL